jgi:hypothetical protein
MERYRQTSDAIDTRFDQMPAFLDGRLMLVIVMATAVWGPMRLGEIEALIGKRYHSSRTGRAAKMLEDMKICVRTIRGARNVTVELDRRHPLAMPLRRLAREMYHLYLEPVAMATPVRTSQRIRYRVPATPKHDAAGLNMHLLGSGPQIRVLHLVAESISMPGFAIRRFLGASRAVYKAIRSLEKYGIVRTIARGQDLYVRLDRSWPGHTALWLLVRQMNKYLPEYAAFASVNRRRRRIREYTWETRLRRARQRRRRPFANSACIIVKRTARSK